MWVCFGCVLFLVVVVVMVVVVFWFLLDGDGGTLEHVYFVISFVCFCISSFSLAKAYEITYLADLRSAPFSEVYNHTDPDDALNTRYSIFNNVLERYAPQKRKRIKYPVKPEWLTPEIREAIRYRGYLLRLNLFDEYKKHRNKVTCMICD